MVGFVQDRSIRGSMKEHAVTCFFAEKDKSNLYEDQVSSVADIKNKKQGLNQVDQKETKDVDMLREIDLLQTSAKKTVKHKEHR